MRGWHFRSAIVVAACVLTSTAVGIGASDAAPGPTYLGPLNSRVETATTSWGRDGGISVPLPGGRDFWVFGDTPRYQFINGKWKLNQFIFGSSAGTVAYSEGQPPAPFTEIVPRQPNLPGNQPSRLLTVPNLYMPDGSGRPCNKTYGGESAGAARWATGAVLLPDQTNILIPYMGVCVLSADDFTVESWGFSLFNWKTNRFTVQSVNVFGPSTSGAAIPTNVRFGSPIVSDGQVTFFSLTCCSTAAIYTATVPLTVAALSDPSS